MNQTKITCAHDGNTIEGHEKQYSGIFSYKEEIPTTRKGISGESLCTIGENIVMSREPWSI